MRLGRHQDVQLLRSLLRRKLVVNHIPVEVVRGQELLQVETSSLLQEFGLAGVRRIVVERDQDETGQGHDLASQLEHSCCSLDLSFEPVRGRTEPTPGRKSALASEFPNHVQHADLHHKGTDQLHQKLLPRQDGSDMLNDEDFLLFLLLLGLLPLLLFGLPFFSLAIVLELPLGRFLGKVVRAAIAAVLARGRTRLTAFTAEEVLEVRPRGHGQVSKVGERLDAERLARSSAGRQLDRCGSRTVVRRDGSVERVVTGHHLGRTGRRVVRVDTSGALRGLGPLVHRCRPGSVYAVTIFA